MLQNPSLAARTARNLCAALAIPLGGALLAACAPATQVSVAANASAKYSHVYITASAIWFNTSATAGPDDTTWLKYPLAAPVTIDLASGSSDAVVQLTQNVKLTPGTYTQVRLMPLDSTDALASSASSLGAIYNAEVDYTDSTGATVQAPLELLNPVEGIGLTGTLKVARGDASSSSTSAPAAFSMGLAFDASRDLVALNDGSGQKMLFSPHGTAFDLSLAGAITGSVEVSVLANVTLLNGRSNIEVSAETLSADASRHQPVLTVPVRADGTFTLFPLATDTTTPSTYDLVIHGPTIATVVIRGVTVAAGSATASTTTSIGSIAPRDAGSFNVNLAPAVNATIPAGAAVRFYQTLSASGEVPYAIEQDPIDPLTHAFAADVPLSNGTIDVGDFSASGSTVALTAQTPVEAAGVYKVSGTAPNYADGPLTTTVAASGSSGTGAVTVAVPSLSVASGAVAATLITTVTQAVPQFDRGELILSRNGAVIDSVSLQPALIAAAGTATNLTFTNLPGGNTTTTFDSGLYYLSLRIWNSTSPTTTFQRDSFIAPVDLRSVNSATLAVPIN